MGHPAHVLCGPTASGKTDLAHAIARQTGWPILSADAMQVYQGMDIGTAKPTAEERKSLRYSGLDWVSPDQSFSVGTYKEMALAFVRQMPADQPVLIVGGTGLYIKALLQGLDDMPPVDPAIRAEVETLFAEQGLEAVQAACRCLSPERYQRLQDPNNPRRVMRALELAKMGVPLESRWDRIPPRGQTTMIDVESGRLHERIQRRAAHMFANGLLEETAALQERWPCLSPTARQAIGYREAAAVLDGTMDLDAALQQTCTRTRQYARRQRTWFRHQLPCESIVRPEDEPIDRVAERVLVAWRSRETCEIVW